MKQKRDVDWILFLGIVLIGSSLLTIFLYTNWEILIGFAFALISFALGMHFLAIKKNFQFSKQSWGIYLLTLGLIELFLTVSTKSEEPIGLLLGSTLIIGETVFVIVYKYKESTISSSDSHETT